MENHKCYFENNFINPCHFLESIMNKNDGISIGLFLGEFTNYNVIAYRKNKTTNPIIINFCPWCGEKFNTEFEEKNA